MRDVIPIKDQSFGLLGFSFCLLLFGFSFCLLLFAFSLNLCIDFGSLVELHFKTLVFLFRSEFCTKLFSFRLLVRNILGSPSPAIITCFKLLQFTEDVFLDDIVIHDTFVRFVSSHQYSNIA